MATSKRCRAKVVQDEGSSGCGVLLPFDLHEVFGKVRVPVVAELKGHSFRTTTVAMEGKHWIPLNAANRTAAGVRAGETVTLTLTTDDAPRAVEVPAELAVRLRKSRAARERWEGLSYTRRKELAHGIESAKKPETRARRVEKALDELEGR